VLHLGHLPDFFVPSVNVLLETIPERDIFYKIVEVANFAGLFPFAGSLNAIFYIRVTNELNHWDVEILATLSQVHL
jgi:hypothetical protein